jgi:hypothetical protein
MTPAPLQRLGALCSSIGSMDAAFVFGSDSSSMRAGLSGIFIFYRHAVSSSILRAFWL